MTNDQLLRARQKVLELRTVLEAPLKEGANESPAVQNALVQLYHASSTYLRVMENEVRVNRPGLQLPAKRKR